jgi:hypothetical protein
VDTAMMGLEFLVGGGGKHGEPGVLLSFGEPAEKAVLEVLFGAARAS